MTLPKRRTFLLFKEGNQEKYFMLGIQLFSFRKGRETYFHMYSFHLFKCKGLSTAFNRGLHDKMFFDVSPATYFEERSVSFFSINQEYFLIPRVPAPDPNRFHLGPFKEMKRFPSLHPRSRSLANFLLSEQENGDDPLFHYDSN